MMEAEGTQMKKTFDAVLLLATLILHSYDKTGR